MTNTFVQFTLSNGNAFFCICYWLTFLDLHPFNICKKSLVLYMILFYPCRELHLLEDDNHWDLTFADAALISSPHQICQLFSIILTCFPSEASALCFSHRQLYVACSWVGKLSNCLCILLKDCPKILYIQWLYDKLSFCKLKIYTCYKIV